MKKLSRQAIWLMLAYLGASVLLTLLILRYQNRHPEPVQEKTEEAGKKGDRLEPHELFYLDRQYPSADLQPEIYQARLLASMSYDQAHQRSNRGLEFPWTLEGPGNLGGRVNAIAVNPEDPAHILLGYSQGGLYHTDDGGLTWTPVFDEHPSLSISHITFDPHRQGRVWAATGDVNISGYPFLGSGVYRSDDGGIHWVYSGLQATGVLSKIVADPTQEDILYAGSMGYPSHKGPGRGLFRSTDGGNSWQQTLTIDDSTGIIDIVADPIREGHVYATAWTRIRNNKRGTTRGPGTGVYKSMDHGATWTNLTQGLPAGIHSRTGVEITQDGTLFISYIGDVEGGDCNTFIESLQGIYKSVDGGISWDTVPAAQQHGLPCGLFGQFGWYFEVLKVNPNNPNDMFLLGVDIYRTLDGGLSWFEGAPVWWTYEVHADKHDLVYAHGNIYLGTDGGAYRTDELMFPNWSDIENIPSTQFYRTSWNPHLPEFYYGGAQDNGTTGGNSTFFNEWPRILGGDGFQPLFDPDEPDWMYAMTQNGAVYISEDGGFDFRGLNKGLSGARYWDMPLVMSPHDPKVLFCGSYKLFRIDMKDTSRTWLEISPDLTRGDTLGSRYPAITAIAQSPVDVHRLYAGTQDGYIWTSGDGGVTWENITEGTPGFYVTSITCSTIDPLGVYATYSGYRDNDHTPYIYHSDNAGAAWESIAADMPMLGVNSFFILPDWNDDVLMAATDGGVYVSRDAGATWERMGSNMPYMPVYDLDYNPVENKIIAATFSRGIMTFPVEELDLVSGTDEDIASNRAATFDIYPTCIEDVLYIRPHASSVNSGVWQGRIISLTGVVMAAFEGQSGEPRQLEVSSSWPAGSYLVQVNSGRERTHQIVHKL